MVQKVPTWQQERRVFIIEDDNGTRRVLRTLLERAGYTVGEARSAGEAIDALTTRNYPVCLCDLHLPDAEGAQIVLKLCSLHPSVGIIVLTAHPSIESATGAIRSRAWDYFTKPVDRERLLSSLNRFFEHKNLQDHIQQTQQELAQTRRRLDFLLSNVPVVVYSAKIRPAYAATYVSTQMEEQFGWPAEDFLTDEDFWFKRIHPHDVETVARVLPQEDGALELKYRFLHRDGTYRWVKDLCVLISDEEGNPLEIIGALQDVTQQKEAEEKLRAEEVFRNAAMDMLQVGLLVIDRQGRIGAVNKAFCALTGFSEEELLGTSPPYPFLTQSVSSEILQTSKDLCPGPGVVKNLTLRPKRGSSRRARARFRKVDFQRDYVVVTFEDVSRELRSQQVLQENIAFLQEIVGALPVPVFYHQLDGRILGCNRAFAELIGRDIHHLIGATLSEAGPQQFAAFHDTCCRKTLGGTSPATHEARVSFEDGTVRDLLLTEAPVRDAPGKTCAIAATVVDVSRLKDVQGQLQEAHRALEQVVAALPCALVEVAPHGPILRWNGTAETLSGLPAERVVGKSFAIWGRTWLSAKVLKLVEQAFSEGKEYRLDGVPFSHLEGRRGVAAVSVTPCLMGKNEVQRCIVLVTDMTEYHDLHQRLSESRKLESIGQLAAGIAHEVNTPTQYVGDNTRFLREAFGQLLSLLDRYEELREKLRAGQDTAELTASLAEACRTADLSFLKEEIPRAIDQSLEGVERISSIVKAMKKFAHPGTGEKVPADLNQAVESTVTVARNEWKYVAEVKIELDPELPSVPCNLGEINQVVLNLILNAAHAIEKVVGRDSGRKGTITVATRRAGRWAEIRITDTGTGIPPEIRPKVFDPFFTTKEVGKGSGQGLALARSIVDRHGGTIEFESEVGKGTTFIIRLPLSEEGVEPCRKESASSLSTTK